MRRSRACRPALTLIAYLTVLAIALSLIALISWVAAVRVDRGEGNARRRGQETQRPRAELV